MIVCFAPSPLTPVLRHWAQVCTPSLISRQPSQLQIRKNSSDSTLFKLLEVTASVVLKLITFFDRSRIELSLLLGNRFQWSSDHRVDSISPSPIFVLYNESPIIIQTSTRSWQVLSIRWAIHSSELNIVFAPPKLK